MQVGEWVLRNACEFNRRRLQAGQQPLRVSVNLSMRQFRDKYLVDRIAQCLEETGLDAKYLELEITESLLA
jgi:EAL domain-containing protein (putative c-di-GMP-specific phosphodiesterase class I)